MLHPREKKENKSEILNQKKIEREDLISNNSYNNDIWSSEFGHESLIQWLVVLNLIFYLWNERLKGKVIRRKFSSVYFGTSWRIFSSPFMSVSEFLNSFENYQIKYWILRMFVTAFMNHLSFYWLRSIPNCASLSSHLVLTRDWLAKVGL